MCVPEYFEVECGLDFYRFLENLIEADDLVFVGFIYVNKIGAEGWGPSSLRVGLPFLLACLLLIRGANDVACN